MTQHPLSQFFRAVKQRSPTLAVLISDDVLNVALACVSNDRASAVESVERIREMTSALPEDIIIIREDSLQGLGY